MSTAVEMTHGRAVGAGEPPLGERTLQWTRIAPSRAWPHIDVRELWAARDVFFFLVWRDVKVRYAQTALGAGWALLQPLMAMLIFTVVFGRFARIPSDGVPYSVFALTALVPWTYFTSALTGSSNSVLINSGLVTKVYFPRLTIPLSPVAAGLVDLAVSAALLAAVLAWHGIAPSPWALVITPVLLLITMLTAAGVGCALAAFNVRFRDVKQITPFLVQLWLYASPVVYPLSLVPSEYRLLYALNPMVGVISGFRAVLLGRTPVPWMEIGVALASSLILFAAGTRLFRHNEQVFADLV